MNKSYFFFTALLAFLFSSCLKDEGFENGEYGTVNENTQGQKWLSIPLGAFATNSIGVESKSGMQSINLFPVSFDFKDPAATDITATVQLNNDLVRAADTSVILLPANAYTLPSTTLTVKAGQRISDPLALNINTSLLDPTKKYGIGFTLSSVSDPDIQVPANLRNVVFIFTIKNRFDAIYTIRSRMDHPSDRSADWVRTPFTYGYEIHLITTGPLTVRFFNTAFGAGFHPLQVPGASGFGQTEPIFEFDESNKLVRVSNGLAGGSLGRDFKILTGTDPKTGATINNRYDPATRTVYAAFTMTQNGFEPINIFDTLTYVRPRP